MTARTLRLLLAAAAATGTFALTGCGTITISTDPSASATPSGAAQQPSTTATGAATDDTQAGTGLGTDIANLNPCSLLTPAEVNQFTGREITQIDRSGSEAGGNTRYCQWQLEEGVLLLSLAPTSADDFAVRDPAAVDFNGVGDEAYTGSGHLYVRSGDLGIDVYSTSKGGDGGSPENIAVEKTTAQRVIDQL